MSVLKVFRTYNKWILAIGVSILMMAFLIQPTLQMFAPNPAKRVEGRINGEKVRVSDLQAANQQLEILGSVSPLLRAVAPEGPLQWVLMKHEARSLGLGASQYEVDQLLKAYNTSVPNITSQLQQHNMYIAAEDVGAAFGDWVMVQRYQDLVMGVGQLDTQELFGAYTQYDGFLRQFPPRQAAQFASILTRSLHGKPSVSASLLKRFIYDQDSLVKVTMLPIKVDAVLDKEPDPSPEAMQELFDKYKNDLEGESEPYGFGYKEPDAVRLEYMTIPFARLRDKVQIKEAQALEYYQINREDYKVIDSDKEKDPTKLDLFPEDKDKKEDPIAPSPKRYRSYDEVVQQIRDKLRDEEANKLAAQMAQAAYTILKQQASTLKRQDNYYVTEGTDWKPMPLSEVAEQLQKRFGVLPDVVSIDDHWMDHKEVAALGGLGDALLQQSQFKSMTAADYIFSVRKLAGDQASLVEPVQVGIAAKPLFVGSSKDYYITRVIDARKAAAPESIDKVRDRVREDARKLAAYKKIIADRDTWLRRANAATSLKDLADQLAVDLVTPPEFPRRKEGRGKLFESPTIPGVGDNANFVKDVFKLVDGLPADKKLADLPPEERLVAAPDARKLTLWLVRVDEYKPITEKQYESRAGSEAVGVAIREAMAGDEQGYDPFSVDAISKRIGYKRERDADAEEAAPAPKPEPKPKTDGKTAKAE